jgi:dolichol-phosphate mannosyltransferase
MPTWIVLPTYNEADTIEQQLHDLRAVTAADIVVVDDNSPDGTGAILDRLAALDTHLHPIHRSGKLGFGSAYIDGFRYSLAHGATIVGQMDADGSHSPSLLPAMEAALESADVVIGSRYIPGGSFPIVWYRRWISTLGNIYIRLMLGWSLHDWSTGYKLWRAETLQRVMQTPTQGRGYAWLMEMSWLARQAGARLTEVPLQFLERRGGESKFSWRIAWEDVTLAWKLRWHRPLPKG